MQPLQLFQDVHVIGLPGMVAIVSPWKLRSTFMITKCAIKTEINKIMAVAGANEITVLIRTKANVCPIRL